LSEKSKEARLCGAAGYDLTVLDFVRWGMSAAAPRFRTADGLALNIMRRADEFAVVVPGREHHAEWFKGVDHPDARLIAAAPELLAELEAALPFLDCDHSSNESDCRACERTKRVKAVIAKAVGHG
jgi:hypothetical protein